MLIFCVYLLYSFRKARELPHNQILYIMLLENYFLVSPTNQRQPESIFFIEFEDGISYLWARQLNGVKMLYPLIMGIIERNIDYRCTVNCYAVPLLNPKLTFNFSGFKRFTPEQFDALYTPHASAFCLISQPETQLS